MRDHRTLSIVVAGLLGACACSRATDQTSNVAVSSTSSKDAAVNPLEALQIGSDESLFLAQVTKADAVFVGTLTAVGPAPTAFSGYAVSTQALTYQVGRVLRGDIAGPTFLVHHVIVGSSPALLPGKPELKPAHTQLGAEYIVAVGGTVEGKRVTANENVGPIKATPALIAKTEQALKP